MFEQHIPEGCYLALDIGELSGSITGGAPNAAELSASGISVAEAPASCGDAYGRLLNVGFGLPSTDADIALDLTVHWATGDHDH